MGELYTMNSEAPLPYSMGMVNMQRQQAANLDSPVADTGYAAIAHLLTGAAANNDQEYGRVGGNTKVEYGRNSGVNPGNDPMSRIGRHNLGSMLDHMSPLPSSVARNIPKDANYEIPGIN
jgi:hypothetical protein